MIMVWRCLIGTEGKGTLCSAVCSNTEWRISKHDDGKYHFDKN